MTLVDVINDASTTVLQRPLRSFLTGVGTTIGVGTLVATIGLMSTTRAQISSRFDALKATEVVLKASDQTQPNSLPLDASSRLAQLKGVRSSGLIGTVAAQQTITLSRTPSVANAQIDAIPILAAQPGALTASRVGLSTGTSFTQYFENTASQVILLGKVAAAQLGITYVDGTSHVFIGDTSFLVLGILTTAGRNPELLLSGIVPYSTAQRMLGGLSADAHVEVDTTIGSAQLVGRQAPIALRPDNPSQIEALVPPDPATLRRQISNDVTTLFISLAFLSLLMGGIAIANSTFASVIQRRGEIGLRRALGASKWNILALISTESGLIAAMGSIAGVTSGMVITSTVSAVHNWTMTVDPRWIVTAPLVGISVGLLAGIVPAYKAAQMDPAIAVRT